MKLPVSPYRRLLPYIRPHLPWLIVGSVLAIVVAAMEGVVAWLVKPAMDEIFIKRDLLMLKLIPLALVAAYVVKAGARYAQAYLMASVGERVVAALRHDLYTHIQGMPLAFFADLHSGDLMSRILGDVGRLARVSSGALVLVVRQVATIVALLVVMFLREWLLTLAALVAFPLIALMVKRIGERLYNINRRAQERIAQLAVMLHESFAGTKIVKAFGREAHERRRFDQLNDRLLTLSLKNVRADEATEPLMEVAAALGIVAAMLYGGYRVIHGDMTPGTFFSFTAAVIMLYGPVRRLARALNTIQQTAGSVERVFEIIDRPPALSDKPGAVVLKGFEREIVFDRVDFRYPGAEDFTLKDIALTVRKGEAVAFVGMSGAGKSTLMDLLPRFHDVTAGRILMDGHDVRDITQASLRDQIGIVTQETFLFSDSVYYNIAYGRLDATADEVVAAARLAQAHDFIEACPEGYQTLVGERGVRLSGGQRQRIAIARAFLKNPPILILDEATSDLDAESEFMVQQALAELMRGRTVLVIAHRLATVRSADRIVVVHEGRIAEAGRHDELLARDGLYRRLYALQMEGVPG
ncbi:MAG TPA: ABC transporter ATP-binding protein [Methylomirabilota bacterium]|nr:ABC transporter ATP-binding protein [Methylomirabilota bacterium]